MGYSIPGADFTTPSQLKTNVGAQGGATLGQMFAGIGQAFIAKQKETAKLTQIKSDYETATLINNNKIVDGLLAKGEDQIKDASVYDQWSNQVISRGKAATDAQMAIRFGDLSNDEKQKQLDIISNFNNYNNKSLKTMGRYIADIQAYQASKTDPNSTNVVIGDLANGENLLNTITMDVASGKDVIGLYGEGATSSRTLNVSGNDNAINSVVSIPKNSKFFKDMKSKNKAFQSVLDKGLETGNIKESSDGKSFTFERNINLNAYEGEGGFDFVVPIGEKLNQTKILQDSGFIDDKGDLLPESFERMAKEEVEGSDGETSLQEIGPIATYQETENLANNNVSMDSFEVLNINKLSNNVAFNKLISAETNALLAGKNTQVTAATLANNYGVSGEVKIGDKTYATMQNFLDSAPTEDVKSFVSQGIRQNILSGVFKGIEEDKSGVSLVRKKAEGKFLDYLKTNNILNEAGEPYAKGEMVYVRETNKIEKKIADKGLSFNQKMRAALKGETPNYASLFAVPIKPQGYDQQILYFPAKGEEKAGVYRVDKDGLKAIGAAPIPQPTLLGLF
tara:strand:+ start:588 stop:2282 length:1695 start_codon:yes stop_codon:yes gene_type:complete